MIHALIPVKSLDRAKGRLAPLLAVNERRALALAMLDDVLAVLRATPQVATMSVVSNDREVREHAWAAGARVVDDTTNSLNDALHYAAHQLQMRNRTRLMVVFADLPLLTSQELELFLVRGDTVDVALGASRDGGTNALLTAHALPFLFGPNSLAQHLHAAEERGLRTAVVHSQGIERDIDRPDDVVWLARCGGTTATARLVRELRIEERAWGEVAGGG